MAVPPVEDPDELAEEQDPQDESDTLAESAESAELAESSGGFETVAAQPPQPADDGAADDSAAQPPQPAGGGAARTPRRAGGAARSPRRAGGDAARPRPAEGASARRLSTSDDEGREEAIAAASSAVQRGELVVLPTDTVYGIGADAFDAAAVQSLLDAKGRGREMPPPVLISSATTLDALATGVTDYARRLVDRFWPGPLTIVCTQQPSLMWDLGETRGTVAVRMPDHPLALDLLERTGPMAVSSANLTGHPAATDADQAEEMLGDAVAVIIDDGPSPGGAASTIVDVRGHRGKILRTGALSLEDLNSALEGLPATIEDEDDD
jgi:L-threonylcarbamoyladenylate synthase